MRRLGGLMKMGLALAVSGAMLSACSNEDQMGTKDLQSTIDYNVRTKADDNGQQSPGQRTTKTGNHTEEDVETFGAAEKEDNTIRAFYELANGSLAVQPVEGTKAIVAPLGAPSCYGLETDLRWQGTYGASWVPEDGKLVRIFTFPQDFEIVQRTDEPASMQHFKLGGTDLLAYVPRYTDCHALETYFFGVKDGQAFPVPIIINAETTLANIGQLPDHGLEAKKDELVITGGYGAGMNTIPVYHFRFDASKKALVLRQTEQAKPNEIIR